MVWVDGLTRLLAGEDPGAVRVCRGLLMSWRLTELSPKVVEGTRDWQRHSGEPDGNALPGNGDVRPGKSNDVLDALAEHQDEDARGAVPEVHRIGVREVGVRLTLLCEAHPGRCPAAVSGHLEVGVD